VSHSMVLVGAFVTVALVVALLGAIVLSLFVAGPVVNAFAICAIGSQCGRSDLNVLSVVIKCSIA
jgi:hypothetical protein